MMIAIQKINIAFKANVKKNGVTRAQIAQERATVVTQKNKKFVPFVTIWKNRVTLTGHAKMILHAPKKFVTFKQKIQTALLIISTVF
jgi:hypothetical protein